MSMGGFTLLETLVAFTLLSVVLAASYAGFDQGLNADRRVAVRLAAIRRAEDLVAALRADVEPDPPAEGWTEVVDVTPGAVPGLLEVIVTVRGPGGGDFALATSVLVR